MKRSIFQFGRTLLVNSFIGWFFDVFLIMLLSFVLEGTFGRISLQILTFLIYIVFVYHCSWKRGYDDYNLVRYGHETKNMSKGLLGSLVACIPSFFIIAIYLISYYAIGGNVYGVINIITRVWFMPYTPTNFYTINVNPLFVFVFLVPFLLFGSIAYIAGYHGISVMDKMTFKNSKNRHGRLPEDEATDPTVTMYKNLRK